MYVAVTRAGDTLHMTLARKRSMVGRGFSNQGAFSSTFTIPSRFLKEITPGLVSGFYPSGEEELKRGPGGFGGNKFGSKWEEDHPQDPFDEQSRQRNRGSGFESKYGNSSGYGGSGYEGKYGSSKPSQPSQGYRPTSYGNPTGGYRSGSGSSSGSSSGSGGYRSGSGSNSGGQARSSSSSGSPYGARKPEPAKPRAYRMPTEPAAAPKEEVKFERLQVGDKVSHVKFGEGKVVQVIGEGEKQLYSVEFPGEGKRLLDPKFAKLIKLS